MSRRLNWLRYFALQGLCFTFLVVWVRGFGWSPWASDLFTGAATLACMALLLWASQRGFASSLLAQGWHTRRTPLGWEAGCYRDGRRHGAWERGNWRGEILERVEYQDGEVIARQRTAFVATLAPPHSPEY